jgi:hypothetical protein
MGTWTKQTDGSYTRADLNLCNTGTEWAVFSDTEGLITTADTLADAKSRASDYLRGML